MTELEELARDLQWVRSAAASTPHESKRKGFTSFDTGSMRGSSSAPVRSLEPGGTAWDRGAANTHALVVTSDHSALHRADTKIPAPTQAQRVSRARVNWHARVVVALILFAALGSVGAMSVQVGSISQLTAGFSPWQLAKKMARPN
jgi:hypothetical protein